MLLILNATTSALEIENLLAKLKFMGFDAILLTESNRQTIAIINDLDARIDMQSFATLPNVAKVVPFSSKFKLVSKDIKHKKTIINIAGHQIGGDKFVVMAGPCSIESKEQIFAIAEAVAQQGAIALRGGAFKPRTSPYDFQGLGEHGLQFMSDAAKANNLLCVSEVMNTEEIEMVAHYVDIVQVGARNMQNFSLLKALGKINKPILLKRGLSATYHEFLHAAEYILSHGNPNVILCERGIRTFETYARNTLDIAAVPILKELTHLPIIIDPSHGTGLRNIVPPMAKAALAVEAAGIIVEVHTDPDRSVSDAKQTISTEAFAEMMENLRKMAPVVGMKV